MAQVSESGRAPAVSGIAQIQAAVEERWESVIKAGVSLGLKREIAYGAQLDVEAGGERGCINIYYSKKKGLSFVDCSKNRPARVAIAVLKGEQAAPEPHGDGEHEFVRWIGTDESGKGDFFGPLVTAAFYTERECESELRSLGVTDSKSLGSRAIRRIAGGLRSRYPESISIVAPSCRAYNDLYASFRNLNRLLGWSHARAIRNLTEGVDGRPGKEIDGVVVDRFGDERHIRTALRSMSALKLIQRPKGESNLGVAAASILAREGFERRMAMLETKYSMRLPFGAGENVTAAARKFIERHGREALYDAAKTHFKTFRELEHG